MDQKKSPGGRGRKKKSEIETKKSPEKQFVEGSGIPKDQIEVGFKLMAASFDGKWYQGRIVEVDDDDNTFLVHFDFWNSRFDEWYKFTTKKVKPMEEEPYARKKHTLKFICGDTVLARWVDGKQYRGKIEKVKANDKYDVVFEDGVIYSTTVDMLKIGDKIDSSLEVERFTKQQEQFQRSKERENRSIRRSLEPGSTLAHNSSTPQDTHQITSVKYLSKIPRNLALTLSVPLKKIYFSYHTQLSSNAFATHGTIFNVPSAALVFGSENTPKLPDSPEIKSSEDFSPRKRGRPKVNDTPTPTKHFKSDFSPNSKSPVKKSPNKTPIKTPFKPSNARSPEPSEEKSTTKPKKTSPPSKCTVSVQTDPVSELTEHTTPVTSSRVDPIQPRPLPPAPHQATPPVLQTETVLTSDGRWITIATPPTNQQPSDIIPRPPASNFYYQLVPMGANGPIQQPPPPLPIPATQPQDPLQQIVLAQPHNPPVMVLPQGQALLQQPQPRALLQPSYIQQQRPIMQYQATSGGILQTQPASTVLVQTNAVPNVQQHVVIPQQQSVAAPASVVTVAPPSQIPASTGASPPVAQRQTDPPSALQLTSTAPLPVSPGPVTSSNTSQTPFPPVSSNLTASRTTIRLPEVQASKEIPPVVSEEQTENGGLENLPLTTASAPISLSSGMPFSSLLSSPRRGSSEGEKGDVPIATIFAPTPTNLPASHPNQVEAPVKLIPQDNSSNQTNTINQNDPTNLINEES